MATYNQPTSAPTAKVAAVGKAGIAAVIIPAIVLVLSSFGVVVPDEISNDVLAAISAIVTVYAAIQAVVQFIAGYIKKSETK